MIYASVWKASSRLGPITTRETIVLGLTKDPTWATCKITCYSYVYFNKNLNGGKWVGKVSHSDARLVLSGVSFPAP